MMMLAYKDVELPTEGGLHGGHEVLAVSAQRDIADGDGDLQPFLLPPPAALLQLRRVPGARMHARPKPRQLLHDRMTAAYHGNNGIQPS